MDKNVVKITKKRKKPESPRLSSAYRYKFGSESLSSPRSHWLRKFVNALMIGGKKKKAAEVVFKAFSVLKGTWFFRHPLLNFFEALEALRLPLHARKRKTGFGFYIIVTALPWWQQYSRVFMWFRKALITSTERRGFTVDKLSTELSNSHRDTPGGLIVKKRIATLELAEEARLLGHFRWREFRRRRPMKKNRFGIVLANTDFGKYIATLRKKYKRHPNKLKNKFAVIEPRKTARKLKTNRVPLRIPNYLVRRRFGRFSGRVTRRIKVGRLSTNRRDFKNAVTLGLLKPKRIRLVLRRWYKRRVRYSRWLPKTALGRVARYQRRRHPLNQQLVRRVRPVKTVFQKIRFKKQQLKLNFRRNKNKPRTRGRF